MRAQCHNCKVTIYTLLSRYAYMPGSVASLELDQPMHSGPSPHLVMSDRV